MNALAFVAFTGWCAWLAIVDLREMRLPNRLTIPGGCVVLAYGTWAGEWRSAVIGAALLAGAYALVHCLRPQAMGAGDVKFAVGLGGAAGIAGAHAWVIAAMLAPVLTAVVGIAYRRRTHIPHGPSMSVATVCAVLVCG